MVDIDRAANAFPEVELDVIKKIYAAYDDPSLARIADVLEQAKHQGKVPDADYSGRVDGTVQRKELHPEFAEWLERQGLDPNEAEEGLRAEEKLGQEDWKNLALETVDTGSFQDVIDLYIEIRQLTRDILKSPNMRALPEDIDIASSALSSEIQTRVEQAGERGDPEELHTIRTELLRLPDDELREAYLEMFRPWYQLAQNDGTEFDEAKQYVFDAESPDVVADRLEEIHAGHRFDVSTEQFQELVEDVKRRLA